MRFLICEENLGREAGHLEPFITGIAACAEKKGYDVVVAGSSRFAGVLGSARVLRYYHSTGVERFARTPAGMQRVVAAFAHNLQFAWRTYGLVRREGPFSVVFATCVNVFHILGWWLVWRLYGSSRWKRLVLNSWCPIWVFRVTAEGKEMPHPMSCIVALGYRLFADGVAKGRVKLVAETEHDAAHLQKISGVPVFAMATPRPMELIAAAREARLARLASPRAPRLGWLGRPSEDKGFSIFVAAMERYLKEEPAGGVEFVVQWLKESTDVLVPWSRLQELSTLDPRVRLIGHSLGPKEYGALVGSLDCVVLPYVMANYVGRNSSTALDAFLSGVPVIATEGTWIAERMSLYGGGLLMKDGDADSLVEQMRRFLRERETITRLAEERSAVARAEISWNGFFALALGD